MKILIVNTSDIEGGAARAAYRLHKSLLNTNIDSKILVQNKKSDDFTVLPVNTTKLEKGFSLLRPSLDAIVVKKYKQKSMTHFSPNVLSNTNVIDKINNNNPDIVHLHWINEGMIKIEDIAKIKAPIVWSLHDMWAFTGGCHYDEECEGYLKECGNCKVLRSGKENDLSRKIFHRKMKVFSKINKLTIVGLSKWLHLCAKKSVLLENAKHINLPNPINTEIFKPFDKKISRKLWNLPIDKKLVLFGAMKATSDPRKGFNELSEAMKKLTNRDIEFVVFGSSQPKNALNFGFKTHYLGTLSDDVSLVTLYSAVDVMVVPSLQENLSNAIMESLSCGTPVVSFDIGGNSDMIEHKSNGYLAEAFNTCDLANGIEWILHNKDVQLSINARKKVLEEFDSKLIAKKYIQLYKEVLNEKQS